MTCDEAKPLLPAYFANEVVGRQKTLLKKHLQGCPDCRSASAKYKKAASSSKDLPKVEPAEDHSNQPPAKMDQPKTPEMEPVQDRSEQMPMKARPSKMPLAALVLLAVTGLTVFLVLSPSPSNKSIPEFRLISENPMEAQKVIRGLVELLDGTILPKRDAGQIAMPAAPTAAGIAVEDVLLITMPIKDQSFFLSKLDALGILESVSSAGQPSDDKFDASSMVTLKLTIGASAPAPQKK